MSLSVLIGDDNVVIEQNDDDHHNENIAEFLDESILAAIASDLLAGIEEDDRSRTQWLSDRAKGLDILGLRLEAPRADLGSSAAPMEGMSNVRHPLLLEAAVRFQANCYGELFPADGPVKVENKGQETEELNLLGDKLEGLMNTYLTITATEYYPDSDKSMFGVGFSGCNFKKGFHCPIRNRPVIESVDAKDLIINNTATDLQNAQRITQVIRMPKQVFRRMQIAEAYRDIEVPTPLQYYNRLDAKQKRLEGIEPNTTRTEDQEYTIYECYCYYDIPGFEHEIKGEKSGIPLPYKVSIDKTTRTVLEIRRHWKENDKEFHRRRTFVMYPFVPMFGLYPMGLLHLIGNTTNAATAGWRILLDSGMFGNFPGFLYPRQGDDQTNNSLRVAPGSGVPVDVPAGQSIRDAFLPLPYKTPDAVFPQVLESVVQAGQRLAGTAETQVGEGRQDAPVGTTLALIEQGAKVMSAVHKRLHRAQSEEFQMLRELLLEDPEALWRHNPDGEPWGADQVIEALRNFDLIPVADPNVPSHMHRMAQAQGLKMLASSDPARYDLNEVDAYCMRVMHIPDPERFFAKAPPPGAQQPHPELLAIAQKAQADQASAQSKQQANQLKLVEMQLNAHNKALDRQQQMELEKMRLAERLATHPASAPLVTGGV